MARITVEDCIDKLPSRFELVLVASNRARKLHSGEKPTVEIDNDKNTVVALREIAEETIHIEEMKKNLIEDYQTVSLSEEEEEIILENSYQEEDENFDLNKENHSLFSNEESKVDFLKDNNEISNDSDIDNNNANSESEILK